MVRYSVVSFVVVGLCLVMLALTSDHQLAQGWGPQVLLDTGKAIVGVAMLYLCIRTFAHVRTHEIRKDPDSVPWKLIAFSNTIIISCAYIIGSVLHSSL